MKDTSGKFKLDHEDTTDTPAVKVKRMKPNSASTYISKLLSEGFRGNVFWYRDNDRRLILKVWEKEGLVLTKEQRQKFMHDVTFPDTITRHRRELRDEFPDSPAVFEKRHRLFVQKRDEHSRGGFLGRLLRSKV